MSDKDIDLAIAGYNDCRSEIRDRVGLRDQWIARYVFGVVAFLGASIGIDKLDPDSRIMLCLVMPAVSLLVAINVSAHVQRIEELANFLRGPLNDFFIMRAAWAPQWDWKNSQDRQSRDPREHWGNQRRRLIHILSIHLPSLVSLTYAATLIARQYSFCFCLSLPVISILFILACGMVAAAIGITWTSFDGRFRAVVTAKTAPGYVLKDGNLKSRAPTGADAAGPATATVKPSPSKPRRKSGPPRP